MRASAALAAPAPAWLLALPATSPGNTSRRSAFPGPVHITPCPRLHLICCCSPREQEDDLADVSAISALNWFNTRPSWVHLNTEVVAALLPWKPNLARFLQDRQAGRPPPGCPRCR